jgi:hypothetical protein
VRKVRGERTEYEGEIYNTGKRFELSWTPSIRSSRSISPASARR